MAPSGRFLAMLMLLGVAGACDRRAEVRPAQPSAPPAATAAMEELQPRTPAGSSPRSPLDDDLRPADPPGDAAGADPPIPAEAPASATGPDPATPVAKASGNVTAAVAPPADAAAEPGALFILERTKNRNRVVYELGKETIHPYWIMLAQDGHKEELCFGEPDAYGAVVTATRPDTIEFHIGALKAYPITVQTRPASGEPFATLRILDQPRTLRRIYLETSEGLFSPTVHCIYFDCQSGADAAREHFKLTPQKDGSWAESRVDESPHPGTAK